MSYGWLVNMNAVVGLSHFCEAHGPSVVLCTRVQNQLADCQQLEENVVPVVCGACNPQIGQRSYFSKTRCGSVTNFYYTCRPPFPNDTHILLQRACMRSLSCEVSPLQENPIVFFGDSTGGYVLSYAFQIKDTRARGLKRWFSFIVLMKDKMYLLNLMPHLSKELEGIAKELQDYAEVIFTKDQSVCSQRSLRLKNNKMPNDAPRSLIELTGKEHIFAFLHTKFSALLNSCSKIFNEVICDGLLPDTANFLLQKTLNGQMINKLNMYDLQKYLGKENFLNVIFCVLTGIQIIIRGDSNICSDIVNLLETLLPKQGKNLEYSDYVLPIEARLYYCKSNVAVPKPCSGIFRIDIVKDQPIIHWLGILPSRWPSLMSNLIKAIDDEMKEEILNHHIIALKEEWLNNVMVLKCLLNASSGEEMISATKKTMGLKAEDDDLINYWISNIN